MTNLLVTEFLAECPQWKAHARTVPVPGLDNPTTTVMTGTGKWALYRWAVARGVAPSDARAAAGLCESPEADDGLVEFANSLCWDSQSVSL